MMRRTACQLNWKFKAKLALERAVRKFVPDPREKGGDRQNVDYADMKRKGQKVEFEGIEGMPEGQSLEDYMKERDQKWLRDRVMDAKDSSEQFRPSANNQEVFYPNATLGREGYTTAEDQAKAITEVGDRQRKVDEEKLLLRRQLAMENEEEYRKHQAEIKRAEMTLKETAKQRVAHPSDPNYDPFKHTPSYRPQDSTQLANWLKRQRESGKTSTGLSLNTREGQERFYNEEKMATQFHANPFASHVEHPKGIQKLFVNGYSPDSIFLNNKEVIGSCIITPTGYYHWNVSTFEEITLQSLSMILHMYPVPEVCFLGTGRNLMQVDQEIVLEFQKRGTVLWCCTTGRALSEFNQQLDFQRRAVCAVINQVPQNSYGRECFGDFVENDMFSLSDTELGIQPHKQYYPQMYKQNKVAEKYRDGLGSGYGPKYHELSDGRLVRPGTAYTKLRPMIEPGEDIEWEKLPSYHHWFPKEEILDYVENTTYRETKGKQHGRSTERRMEAQIRGEDIRYKDEEPEPDLMPWDSASIPNSIIPALRDPDHIAVTDTHTGRVVGMSKDGLAMYQKMMKERQAGLKESDPVEFDQERFVANRQGIVYDMSKAKYVPAFEGRYNPTRKQSTGRGNAPFMV